MATTLTSSTPTTTTNQPGRMPEHNAWAADASLQWWAAWATQQRAIGAEQAACLTDIGSQVGSHYLQDAADEANRSLPELVLWNRDAQRLDDVRFCDEWHTVLNAMLESGVTGMPWRRGYGYAMHVAGMEMWARLDIGAMCPVSMTTAAIPVLRSDERWSDLADRLSWEPGAADGAAAGMAMTEPQGGSDLADSTAYSTPCEDGSFLLFGHKWFVSYPVADVLLVLAIDREADEHGSGLSCFAVPGWLEDGTRNHIELQRLKDKLGTRSLPSAEAMLTGARGWRVGAPGSGVRTIMDMVVQTRLHCAVGSSGVMMRAVQEATSYAVERRAFGKPLIDQPLMRAVLADLALEREASIALTMEVARSFDAEDPLARLLPALAKYRITRRGVAVAVEACECLGGPGYTEEFVVCRLFRDSQVNSTWEGSGNVIVLDVFRALRKNPELMRQLRERVTALVASHPDGSFGTSVLDTLPSEVPEVIDGRMFVERMAIAMQAALLVHRAGVSGDPADDDIARMFVASRTGAQCGGSFGATAGSFPDAVEALIGRTLASCGRGD